MVELTARLGLPLLQAGQAQKEVTHNEALARLDRLAHLVVESRGLATPPAGPQAGQCWIVAGGATGAWSGHEGSVAEWDGAGWSFLPSALGMIALIRDEAIVAVHTDAGWQADFLPVGGLSIDGEQLFGAPRSNVMEPVGGSVIDVEARNCLGELLVYLRSQGIISN